MKGQSFRTSCILLTGDTLNFVNKLVNTSATMNREEFLDDLGRMENNHAVISASRYKADKYHGMVRYGCFVLLFYVNCPSCELVC